MKSNVCRGMVVMMMLALVRPGESVGALLPTTFTYQGQLKQQGTPVNDTCDLQVTLWAAENGGPALGGPRMIAGVDVTGGLFTAELDFGADVFGGNPPWLEIAVRCPAGGGNFTTLSPRQPITAAPYAIQTRGIDVAEDGTVHVDGNLTTSRAFGGPAIELFSTQPYIDFHYNNDPADNNVRIINPSDGVLSLEAPTLSVSGKTYFAEKVGIGTAGPEAGLHVLRGSAFPDAPIAEFESVAGGAQVSIKAQNSADTWGLAHGWSTPDDFFILRSDGVGTIVPLMIRATDGNVGIGTTVPGRRLEVKSGNGSESAFRFGDPFGYGELAAGSTAIQIRGQNGETRVHVDQGSGSVGIGTANPQAKLDVTGGIRAAGEIRSTVGGFRFPNGTLQSSAGLTSALTSINSQTGSAITLQGSGGTSISQGGNVITISSPTVPPGGITSINSQTGPAVTLAAGTNVSIAQANNQITISATGGPGGIASINGATGPAISIQGMGGAQVTRNGNTIIVNVPKVLCTYGSKTYSPGAFCRIPNSSFCGTGNGNIEICLADGSWNFSTGCTSAPICGQ